MCVVWIPRSVGSTCSRGGGATVPSRVQHDGDNARTLCIVAILDPLCKRCRNTTGFRMKVVHCKSYGWLLSQEIHDVFLELLLTHCQLRKDRLVQMNL